MNFVQDCSGEGEDTSCVATLRGMECKTWQQIMVEVFKLGNALGYLNVFDVIVIFSGTSCSQDSECPEACYINNNPATCGPYL